jgi:hypothetical protein
MHPKHLITACAVIGALSALAAAPIRWDSSIERPTSIDIPIYQGETVSLSPRLLTYGAALSLTNATATLYYQTNGMAAAWWTAPASVSGTETGRISATWSPTNDIGAAKYSFFIRATLSDSSSVYRAFGTLSMRSSPGYAPTAAPAPAYQWVTPADMQAASNALASAIQALAAASTAISNLVVAIPAQTNQGYVAQAGTSQVAVVADRLLTSATITLTNMIDEAAGNYEVCTISAAETRIKSYVASNLAENVVITKTGIRFALDSDGAEYNRTYIKYVSHDGDMYLDFPTESGTIETQDRVNGLLDPLTNKIATAWQNPASATNWTWTKTATAVTLTGYSGPAAVVIPDTLDNLPVTGFGTIFAGVAITSIGGGANITAIEDFALHSCPALTSVNLPNATTIGYAFYSCPALTSVNLPNATNFGVQAFDNCTALTSINLNSATTVGLGAFAFCSALTSVYFGQNAPAEATDVYIDAPNVTNYVTSPTATGWGATWNGRPVVRLPVYADTFTGGGAGLTNIPIAGVSGLQGALDGKLGTNGVTAGIIAAAGGVVTNAIPGPGCTYLGTSQAVTLTGATTSYRSEPAGVYTVSVAQAASRYTYALEVISTNPCTLAAGLNLQGSWTITGTNILAIVPCTGTLWRVYGRGI